MTAETTVTQEIPIPPYGMRQFVGPTDPKLFDNPTGRLVFPYVPAEAYEQFFDFGCGCGRIARQLIQQRQPPSRYVGIDLHRGMIEWCKANLQPFAPRFEFYHHDVVNVGFNPGAEKAPFLPFPVEDDQFTLVNAWSVFTHLVEPAARHYFAEVARVLRKPDGIFHSTWFLFDKTDYPMMQEFQNALYINEIDPTNAVIFDKAWVRTMANEVGLTITWVKPPSVRGFQWVMLMRPTGDGIEEVEFPEDKAPAGIMRPPVRPGMDPEPPKPEAESPAEPPPSAP